MHMTTYKHTGHTPFVTSHSASFCNVDAFTTNTEFVQLHSQS